MTNAYARDLDLNLLRVFVVVAETGSATAAAARLYLTQPAISAALKRLADAVGAPLFAREGRGLVLTARGRAVFDAARPHLDGLVAATLKTTAFDPSESERTIRIGLSDAGGPWLLPPLVRALEREAPRMRVIAVPVQFRSLPAMLASAAVDLAVTVADEVPAGTRRRALYHTGFVCLYDPRHARVGKRLTLRRYLDHAHVVVSYNADMRGIVEDVLGIVRRAPISVPTFHDVGGLVEGTALLATVPETVARQITAVRTRLRATALPFALGGAPVELIWRGALDDDPAVRFVMDHVTRIARDASARWRGA